MNEQEQTRERVRQLVRQVLETTPLAEEETEAAAAPPPSQSAKIIDVAPLAAAPEKEFDRDESAKTLITEDDLRGLKEGAKLRVADNARFTPLASDLIGEKRIELVKKSARGGVSGKVRSIALGCDHGGFEFKEKLKVFLTDKDFQVRDFGTNSDAAVDYPDFAHAVAKAVAEKSADVGIIIDGAGIGSAMTANKIPGARAAACYTTALAKNSREHNGANVLTLGSKQNSFKEICEIVEAFLATDLTEERHQKRVAKIEAIERQFLR
jgi:ribose 5-phosphate isomerase B